MSRCSVGTMSGGSNCTNTLYGVVSVKSNSSTEMETGTSCSAKLAPRVKFVPKTFGLYMLNAFVVLVQFIHHICVIYTSVAV